MAIIYAGNLGDGYRFYNSDTSSFFVSATPPTQLELDESNSKITLINQSAGIYTYVVNGTNQTISTSDLIPSVVKLANTVPPEYAAIIDGNVQQTPMTFVVKDVEKKAVEAASQVFNTFGGQGSFSKLTANLPSFDKIGSGLLLSAAGVATSKISSTLGNQVGSLVSSNLGGLLGSSASVVNGVTKATYTSSNVSASQIKQASGVETVTSAHRVFLREIGTKSYVYFEVMPEIVEQHTAEYEGVAPSQFPGTFQKYKGNTSTVWTLNATFISRTSAEATQNYDNLMRLRGWMKPFYGDRTGQSYPKKLGAPPPVLLLSGLRDLIGPVPVVITSLNWNWPKDVDYIATEIKSDADGNFIPFPVVLQIPIQLSESYSIEQFNQFSLTDYRTGRLGPAFNNMESDITANVSSSVGDTND